MIKNLLEKKPASLYGEDPRFNDFLLNLLTAAYVYALQRPTGLHALEFARCPQCPNTSLFFKVGWPGGI